MSLKENAEKQELTAFFQRCLDRFNQKTVNKHTSYLFFSFFTAFLQNWLVHARDKAPGAILTNNANNSTTNDCQVIISLHIELGTVK